MASRLLPTNRRGFLSTAPALAAHAVASAAPAAPEGGDGGAAAYKAAVVGHTGRGDYGHGLDVVFRGLPGVEVVALADAGASDAARAKAAERAGAARHY